MSSFGTLYDSQQEDSAAALQVFDPGITKISARLVISLLPGVDPPDLCRCLVPTTVLTLLVRLREDLEKFFLDRHRFSFVADLLF